MAEGKDVQKWADQAMFHSEPMPFNVQSEGPKVHLLAMSHDPLGQIAAACKMYKGEVVRDLSEVTDAERKEFFEQVRRTKLQAPFEFVHFHFLFEGVTRAFTHQMVRQRTATYAQESLRFAVKEGLPNEIAYPPSLAGTEATNYELEDEELDQQPVDQRMREEWDQVVDRIDKGYSRLIDLGMPAEDARGLLPHAVTTRIHYNTDLRALLDHAGNRLCTQAQFEWRIVFSRIREAVRSYGRMLAAESGDEQWVDDRGVWTEENVASWQFDALADIFEPVCYQIGKCAFKANFDRACSIRERVDAHEKRGEGSTEWGDISPKEWLLNPAAAR